MAMGFEIHAILGFCLAAVLLALAPGPDNIFVMTQAIATGSRAGILVTLGLCTGLIAHTLAVALGVAALLKASPLAFQALKIAGALYLLYLAVMSFRASGESEHGSSAEQLSNLDLYQRGIVMNITNPKVSIFFFAFLPQFISAEGHNATMQLLVLGGFFMVCTFFVFGGIAVLAGTLGKSLRSSERSQRVLNQIAGTVFLLLAGKILVDL